MRDTTRRTVLAGRTAALATATLPALVRAQTAPAKALTDLAAAAAKKPPVVWSESSEPAAIAKVIAAFNKIWPDIKVEFIRDTGGNTLAAKAVQETQAGGTPASLLTGDAAQFMALEQRGMLVKTDWTALGVAPALAGSPFMVATTAALGTLVWNTQKVAAADAPKSVDDLVAPRWKGKVGAWIRTPIYASLAKMTGEAAVRAHIEKLGANQVRLYDSTYRLAQEIGAGEIEVGYGLYHATLPAIAAGAPVAQALPDAVGLSTLFSGVVAKGANPEGAQVMAAWLATRDGSDAYEAATGRGNPYVTGSKASVYVGSRKLSEYPLAELPTYVRLLTEFNRMMSSRGAAR